MINNSQGDETRCELCVHNLGICPSPQFKDNTFCPNIFIFRPKSEAKGETLGETINKRIWAQLGCSVSRYVMAAELTRIVFQTICEEDYVQLDKDQTPPENKFQKTLRIGNVELPNALYTTRKTTIEEMTKAGWMKVKKGYKDGK